MEQGVERKMVSTKYQNQFEDSNQSLEEDGSFHVKGGAFLLSLRNTPKTILFNKLK